METPCPLPGRPDWTIMAFDVEVVEPGDARGRDAGFYTTAEVAQLGYARTIALFTRGVFHDDDGAYEYLRAAVDRAVARE